MEKFTLAIYFSRMFVFLISASSVIGHFVVSLVCLDMYTSLIRQNVVSCYIVAFMWWICMCIIVCNEKKNRTTNRGTIKLYLN